jgi:uncharacterized membrane protein (GlpM family)
MKSDLTDEQLQQFLEAKAGRQGTRSGPELTTDERLYQAVYRELGATPANRLSATFSQIVVQRLHEQQKRTQQVWGLAAVGVIVLFLLFAGSVWYFAPQLTQQALACLLQAKDWLVPAIVLVLIIQLLDYKLTQRLT